MVGPERWEEIHRRAKAGATICAIARDTNDGRQDTEPFRPVSCS